MWPPPNMQSLPSKEEIQKAKEEISTIEQEIIETELRLDALRKSLSERKTWIAPIRTTPPEILSLIFIEASRTNWKAPLVLQSVCRRWRDVVVDSPEAWSFIPLSKYSSERRSEFVLLLLGRGHNTPLHISVSDDSLLGYVGRLADRIKCFNLELTTRVLLNRYLQSGHTFHRLERLHIEAWAWGPDEDTPATDDPAAWDMLSFPNLKVLVINSEGSSLVRAISAAPEFPRIQHLTVYCCIGTWRLLDIFTRCATSLESVDLAYENLQSGELDAEQTIYFPHLRYLRLWDFSDKARPGIRFKAATPNLQAHLDDGINATLNAVRVDTDSVVLLHALHTPDLSRYPRLATLCFRGKGEELIEATKCLRDNPALCPDLELIEYTRQSTDEQTAEVRGALMARGDVNGRIIQLKKGTPESREERMRALGGVEMVRFGVRINYEWEGR